MNTTNTSVLIGNGAAATTYCFHCGEPVRPGLSLGVFIHGADRPMCCHGCQAVARTIVDCGLGDYYKYRDRNVPTPEQVVPEQLQKLKVYDNDRLQQKFITRKDANRNEVTLILEGIVCPACIWLIEKRLESMAGITGISINYDTSRACLSWDSSLIQLSKILEQISRLGYSACPSTTSRDQYLYEKDRKTQLLRLGLAGLLGMQVMMNSVALYTGNWSDADLAIKIFLNWFNLALTTPVLLYSAQPFFQGAWRDLKFLRAGMDVPVALGITIAYLGSVRATINGTGDVYYDSVVMFVFLLLLGRYLEFMAKKKAREQTDKIDCALPASATRLKRMDGRLEEEIVPVVELHEDDLLLVRAGESIPADGTVTEGTSTVDESLLTGESLPVMKQAGAPLIAGSINMESPLQLRVTRTGEETVLAGILKIMERAQREKPAFTIFANRIAGWFVLAVLVLAGLAAWYWWQVDRDLWLPVTIAVLVATCPCALSLAAPAAMTAASSTLLRLGIAVAHNNAVEKLAQTTHFVFDKTGTLTLGKLKLDSLQCLSALDGQQCLAIATALERGSEHPAGKALCALGDASMIDPATEIRNHPGRGISGTINGIPYFIGTKDFVRDMTGLQPGGFDKGEHSTGGGPAIFLADRKRWLCRMSFSDEIRPQAGNLIRDLQQAGKKILLLSGDHLPAVSEVAERLGIDTFAAALTPGGKVERLRELRKDNAVIAMVGDGINDAPVLAGADVSIAMGGGTELARIHADMIVMNDHLDTLRKAVRISRRTLAILRENILWAVAYNLLIIPAAALGVVAPWMAALGMSLSSLVVIGNSARLYRYAPGI